MDLAAAASYFDQDDIYDAYTGALLFQAHTSPHDDHTSSGATVRRRTMSTEPGTAPPARRAIRWYGEYWLVGNSNLDTFQGDPVRRSYGLKKSTGLMDLLTPGQACRADAGAAFHAQKEYFRDMVDARSSADWDTMWNVFCPFAEAVTKGSFLRQDGKLYRVRNVYPSVDEFLVAETDQLDDDAVQAATFTRTGDLDLVTDTATPVNLPNSVIQTDVPKFYEFRTEGESGTVPGDRTVFVAQSSITPEVGGQFTMLGVTWRTVVVVPEGDAWAILARRA